MRRLIGPLPSVRLEPTALIYPGAFLTIVGEGLLNLGVVYFLRERYGASPGLIGGFMAYSVLVYVAGCLLLRPVFERLPYPLSLSIAASGMPLSVLLLVVVPSLPLTFLFGGLHRLSAAFFWPPAMGWLSQGVEGAPLNRRQSRFNLSWSMGLVAGYALAGIAGQHSLRLPLLLSIAVMSAYALYFAMTLAAAPALRPSLSLQPASPAAFRAARPASRYGEGTPLRYPAWIGMFASYVVSGMVSAVFPLFATEALKAAKGLVGMLIASRTLAQSLGFLLLGTVGFWHYRKRFLVAAQSFLAALLLLMLPARSAAFYAILLPLLGLASAMSYAAGLFYGIAGSSRRAGRMAVHEAVLNSGYICGSLASGLLYQHFSMAAVVLFCLGCSLLAVLAQYLLLRRIRQALR